MRTESQHPFFLLMMATSVAGGIYALHQRSPSLTLWLGAASVVAFLVRAAVLLRQQEEEEKPTSRIDFEALRALDVPAYGPWIKENIRGHDGIIDQILDKIRRNAGLAGPGRTLGAFMLVGPTGTGKTFLGELFAEALYPNTEPVVLRMNQYKHKDDVFTLIGPPPGQPGYEVGGTLTRPVLEDPHRVIILDEIEKCHLDVQHCLYNVLDTGHCREKSSGRDVQFNASLIFATCNAGVDGLRKVYTATRDPLLRIGRGREALAQGAGFEKAFLARFDGIFLLDELSPLHIAEVACLQIAYHWRQYGIEVTYASPDMLVEAMRRNVEFKEYGVRQLSQLIQSLTDASIEEARGRGVQSVRLHFDRKTGHVSVEEC